MAQDNIQWTAQQRQQYYAQQRAAQQIPPSKPLPHSNRLMLGLLGLIVLALIIVVVVFSLKEGEVEEESIVAHVDEVVETDGRLGAEPIKIESIDERLVKDFARLYDVPEEDIDIEALNAIADKRASDMINEISQELDISKSEAAATLSYLLSIQKEYSYLGPEDSAKMVESDIYDYEDKIELDVGLPLSYVDTLKMDNVYTTTPSVFIKNETKTMKDILEERGEDTSELSEEFLSYNHIEETNKWIEENHGSLRDYFDTLCILGSQKTLFQDLSFMIHNNTVNFTQDLIVYGPDGEIINDLSVKDDNQMAIINYDADVLSFVNYALIPVNYPEGRYIYEYSVYDMYDGNKFIFRTPLDCKRTFLIDRITFFEDEEAQDAGVSMFYANLTSFNVYPFIFTMSGFDRDITPDMGVVVKYYYRLYDQDENLMIESENPFVLENISVNKGDIIELNQIFITDDSFNPREQYFFEIFAYNILTEETSTTFIPFEVN